MTSQNPRSLSPYRDKAIDLSFEWYYDKGSLFSIAFFYKHLDDLIVTQTVNVPYEGNPFRSAGQPGAGGLRRRLCAGLQSHQYRPVQVDD